MASAGAAGAEPSSATSPGNALDSAEPVARPVATPCRAQKDPEPSRLVPAFVMKALERETKPVAPFGTVTGEDDGQADQARQKEPKQPKKKSAKKTNKEKSKKKKEVAGPEVEEGLKLEPGNVPLQEGSFGQISANQEYNPKKFAAKRLEFIKAHREKSGASHKDANVAWMQSDVRADLLSTLPEKELKRRRFL
eukprot:Skav217044  [mRNA]  locus=scaffold7925:4000:4581:+ [translate_table: standard]